MARFHRILGIAALALSVTCAAQTPPSGALDEIVVTAQKRSENVQSVPLSMTTFGSTALEQKAIDGQENPFTVIEANKFQEVQKYLAGTRHMYNPQSMFVSKKTWDRLNKDEQQILLDAAHESAVYQRKFSRDAQEASLATLKKTMEYTELPPAEIAKVRAKLKPVIDKYSANVGADFAKQVFAEIDKVRGK